MPSFHNGAIEIAYLDEGEGDPIVLVHGFASTKNVNWVYPTWVSELKKNGRRVIALDNRGHGDSAKLYDAAQYDIAIMAGDVIALMDHLRIARPDIMGYSLGWPLTAVLACAPWSTRSQRKALSICCHEGRRSAGSVSPLKYRRAAISSRKVSIRTMRAP